MSNDTMLRLNGKKHWNLILTKNCQYRTIEIETVSLEYWIDL